MRKFLFLFFVFTACSVVETDSLKADKLTVQGQIEVGKFAEISLTNSLLFKGIIDSLEVARAIESKAKVELTDGVNSEILTLKRDNERFPFLYYRSNIIKGELGKKYNLSVSIMGEEFLSETVIPEQTNVLNFELFEWISDGVVEPEYRGVRLTIENSSNRNKYFKVLIKKTSEQRFEYARPFIFNTENISTETFPVIVSYVKFNDDGELENQLEVGEDIELKLIAITKEQYDFWKSIKGDDTSFLDGTSFTSEVTGNITNGAFGYWSGESVEFFKFKVE